MNSTQDRQLRCLAGRALVAFMMSLLFCALGINSIAAFGWSGTVSLTDLPLPSGGRLTVVGEPLVHNGAGLSVATFDAPLTPEETIAFYDSQWAARGSNDTPAYIIERTDQWIMISRLHDGFNTVIQLETAETTKSAGFVSIMRVNDVQVASGREFPSLQLLSRTQSLDGNVSSVLSVYQSTDSVDRTTRQCVDALRREDWALVSEQQYQQSKVLLLNHQAARMEVVVNRADSGGSLVIMNEIRDGD